MSPSILSHRQSLRALSALRFGEPLQDQELSRLGKGGALLDQEILRTQAERLLNHQRALEHWGQVGVEWLGVEEAFDHLRELNSTHNLMTVFVKR